MAQPIWITPAGNLGVIPEGVFFQLNLEATEAGQGDISFSLIAGSLPAGIQLTATGSVTGVPVAVARVQGVPLDVSADVTSKFTIRASSQDIPPRVRDRTFEITITGDDAPEFTTAAGSLGSFYDGDQISIQIGYTDTDPADTVIVRLVGGELPTGVTVSRTGLISGNIQPAPNVDEPAGYDLTPIYSLPYDFVVSAINKNYQFTLEVTDGRNSNLRTFEFFVYNRDTITADNTTITADNTVVTADETTERRPFIMNSQPSDLGLVRSDNYYAYQFIGNDYDTPNLFYAISANSGSELPPGLELDPVTGWYYGYIPDQGITEIDYSFNIVVYQDEFVGNIACSATTSGTNRITCVSTESIGSGQPLVFTGTAFGGITAASTQIYYVLTVVNPTQFTVTESLGSNTAVTLTTASGAMTANLPVASDPYLFSIAIAGNIDAEVTWLTDSDLGILDNGDISLLKVEAVNRGGRELEYRLESGAFNELPQGLELLPTGDISGRVSFNTFAIDLGNTTFDQDTTWDSSFRFTVNAYAQEIVSGQLIDVVSVFKEFFVKVRREYNKPYQNLEVQAMPPANDRELIAELLTNNNIFVPDYIFRPTDPYFGKANRVVYQHAFGLDPDTQDRYVESLYLNHYWKELVLGSIETAQAVDTAGNVIYEVVYSRVIDDLVNNQGQSVGKIVNLAYPITDPGDGSTELTQVYPNSLVNMRDQVIDVVGQISTKLPLWMTSKQTDGRVLGFTPAWVMCYTQPGRSREIAYYIATQFGQQLNRVDFKVDRYVLGTELSRNWDPVTQSWTPTPNLTTFDRFSTGSNTFIGTVDIATDLAYSDVNQRTLDYINALGGLDGVISSINNNTLIFVKQQDYNGPPGSNYPTTGDAWQDYLYPYDSIGYDAGVTEFDEAVTVPNGDGSSLNDRMAIYTISVDPVNALVTLTLTTPTEPNDFVQVTRGNFYQNAQLRHPTSPGPGLTEISWLPLETVVTEETFFDEGSVAFTEPVDMYDPTDQFDKYLVFPKANILA
jgi:hypothetical protein